MSGLEIKIIELSLLNLQMVILSVMIVLGISHLVFYDMESDKKSKKKLASTLLLVTLIFECYMVRFYYLVFSILIS